MPVVFSVVLACSFGPVSLAEPLNGREAADDIFYQFMPIAWRDSNNDASRFGDFGGMTASLDYLGTLGVTAVWMNPIFPSPAYHGYQHGPGDQINSWFGSEEDFLSFVQQAHARGIKVFIDFVVYGVSHNSVYYQSAYGNPSSPYDTWLAFTNPGNTQYAGSVYTTWSGATVGFIEWDLRDPNPVSLVTQWGGHWLDPNGDGDPSDGIDGYRLDHVWEQSPETPDGWGYNLDDFWIPWKTALQAVNPSVFTFAEQSDWGITGATLLPAFDAAMTMPFMFGARDSLSSETKDSLYNSMAATVAALPPGRNFIGILGNHDVDRLTSVIGGSLSKAKAAAAILMTQPCPPCIYYGDEIGMLGVKGDYGSDANDIPMREPFKWKAVAGAPMSNYFVLNSQAYNNRYEQNNDGRSVEEQLNVSGSLLEAYRQLIAARKTNVALRSGAYRPITNSNSRIWSFLRQADGVQTVLVAINVNGSSRTFTLNLSAAELTGGSTVPVDLISGQTLAAITDANKAAYSMTLSGYGYRVLSVGLEIPPPPPNEFDGVDIPGSLGACGVVATQNNATGLGDNISELDQLFVRPSASGLRIGVSGNLATDGSGLVLLFDTVPGGQNVLNLSGYSPPPAGPNGLTGTRLDAGFVPDQMIFANTYGGSIYVDQFELPTTGGTVKTYRGAGTVNDGDGMLTGGVNPNGMVMAMNNTNAFGVTGTDASQAATALNGFDMLVPYADIGAPGAAGASIRVSAFIIRSSGDVSNQWLPGLGGGYGNLGLTPDMTTIAGEQFVAIRLSILGDADSNGAVDVGDIGPFTTVLLGSDTAPSHVAASDANCDGAVNGEDIAAFIELLL
jgi:alpha-amylase